MRRVYRVHRVGSGTYVDASDGSSALTEVPRFGDPEKLAPAGSLLAPMPGLVRRVLVEVGAAVTAGQPLLVLEAMKMEQTVAAPAAGVVAELRAKAGEQVAAGQVLAVVESEPSRSEPSRSEPSRIEHRRDQGLAMPVDMAALAADLAAESAVTRALVTGLDETGWRTPTPAAGWDIGDQIGHLAYFDEVAVQSAVRPDEFRAELAAAQAAGGIDPDIIATRYRDRTGAQLLAWFDTARADAARDLRKPRSATTAALVRARHERRVVADRAAHGDLGAHPGHRRRARRHPRTHPSAASRRAHRRRRARLQLRRPRPDPARAPRCASSWPPRTAPCGPGARPTPGTG